MDVFLSRPVSLVAALVLAIVVCVVSFMVLALPAIVGFYYAVRHSRGEEYFIDLPNVSRTASLVLVGMWRCFLGGYILGVAGLLGAVALFVAPALPLIVAGEHGGYAGLVLTPLWLAAFFLAGVTVFNGYPWLIATGDGIGALGSAIRAGRANPAAAIGRGFVLLSPVPAVFVHLLMVLTYPILAAWALGGAADLPRTRQETAERLGFSLKALGLTLLLAGLMVGGFYVFVPLWEAVGFFVWLAICILLAFLWASRFKR